jgi:tetratricopeptide (TPR) repeat protein
LLTGRTPFDQKELLAAGLDQMRRTILEKEPPRPSTRLSAMGAEALAMTATARDTEVPKLVHLLRGDLDWIVMKALEKDRGRRYETANDLARDIDRHLVDEPVIARPTGALYRLQKAARRHKGAFAAAAAIACVLVIAAVVSSMQAIRARSAEKEQVRLRQIAQIKEQKSEQVVQLLKDILQAIGPSVALGRDTSMLPQILEDAAGRIGRDLTNQPEVAVELYLALADTYHDLGLYKQMEAVSRQNLQLAQTTLGEENESFARSLGSLGDALMHFGQLRLGEIHPDDLEECQRRLHDPDVVEAEALCRRSLALNRRLFGNQNGQVANSLNLLANVLETQGRWAEAEDLQREALAMQKHLLGSEHPKVAKLLYELAAFLAIHKDRLADAETMNREALAVQKKVLGDNHPQIAKSLFNLGGVLESQGKRAEAEEVFRQVLAMWKNLHANDRIDVADALSHLALVLFEQSKLEEAGTRELEALAMQRRLLGQKDAAVADSLDTLAVILVREGKLNDAETALRESLEIRRNLPVATHPDVAGSVLRLAQVLKQQGKLDDANALIERQAKVGEQRKEDRH